MQNNITTIFIDLFGVLLGIDQSVVIQYLSKLTDTSYLDTREIAMGEHFMRLERCEINFIQYVEEIRALLPNGKRIDAGALQNMWMNSKVGEMPAVSLLDQLLTNYHVWIISNTTDSHIKNLISKFTFFSLINGIITSERAGTHKPDPKIFQFAMLKANTDSTSAVFIDDNQTNTKSAESLGITSHYYTSFDGLMDFLKKI
mgnify:CR=1 FL=1